MEPSLSKPLKLEVLGPANVALIRFFALMDLLYTQRALSLLWPEICLTSLSLWPASRSAVIDDALIECPDQSKFVSQPAARAILDIIFLKKLIPIG